MSSPTNFTPAQLNDFKSYLKVQKSGKFNMFDPRARQLTGIDEDQYKFVMANYEALRSAVNAAKVAAAAGKDLEQAYPFGYRSNDGP